MRVRRPEFKKRMRNQIRKSDTPKLPLGGYSIRLLLLIIHDFRLLADGNPRLRPRYNGPSRPFDVRFPRQQTSARREIRRMKGYGMLASIRRFAFEVFASQFHSG